MLDGLPFPMDRPPGSGVLEDRHLLVLQGELTGDTVAEQQARVLSQLTDGDRTLDLDLSGLTAIDAAGSQVLVDLFKIMKLRGGRLSLLQVPAVVIEELERRNLDRILPVISRLGESHPAAATPALPQAPPAASHAAAAPARATTGSAGRLKALAVAALVLGALAAGQYLLPGPDPIPQQLRDNPAGVGTGNARLIASLLRDDFRARRRYPASAAEAEALVSRRHIQLLNVYTGRPLRLRPSPGSPGDLTYRASGGGYAIGVLDATGRPLRDARGQELVVTP